MSHYWKLGTPEEVSWRISGKWRRTGAWCPALTLALSRLRICSWNAAGLFRAVKSHRQTHTRRVSVSWAHKAVSHTLQTHMALSSPPFFLNVVAPCLIYYSERRWRAHTEISTQTTLCPSGPDSYLLIPAESVPDITLSYETARSVIPSTSSEMARGKKCEISYTAQWLCWTEKWLWAITE